MSSSFMNQIIQDRIQTTQDLIDTNSDIQDVIKRHKCYWDQVKNYDDLLLIQEIQPRWCNRKQLSQTETEKLTLLLLSYRLHGLDPDYFVSGSGASSGNGDSNCTIS